MAVGQPAVVDAAAGARHDHRRVVGRVGVSEADGGPALPAVRLWLISPEHDRTFLGRVQRGTALVRQPLAGPPRVVEPRGVGLCQPEPAGVLEDVVFRDVVAIGDVTDPVEVVVHHLLIDRVPRTRRDTVEVAQLGWVPGDQLLSLLRCQAGPPFVDVLGVRPRRRNLDLLPADVHRRRGLLALHRLVDRRGSERVGGVERLQLLLNGVGEELRRLLDGPQVADQPLLRGDHAVVADRESELERGVDEFQQGVAQRGQLIAAIGECLGQLVQPAAVGLLLVDQLLCLGDGGVARLPLPVRFQVGQLAALHADHDLQRGRRGPHVIGGVEHRPGLGRAYARHRHRHYCRTPSAIAPPIVAQRGGTNRHNMQFAPSTGQSANPVAPLARAT